MESNERTVESDHMYHHMERVSQTADEIYNNGNDNDKTSDKDPMLSSYIDDDVSKYLASTSSSSSPLPALSIVQSSSNFTLSMDSLLSPEGSSGFPSDLAVMWGNDRKRVTSIKTEDDDTDTFSRTSMVNDDDEEDVDMDDFDAESASSLMDVKSEVEDPEYDDVSNFGSPADAMNMYEPQTTNRLGMTLKQAREYVEARYMQMSLLPSPELSHRQKIEYILKLSDCSEYNVDDVLNFDRRSQETALACARIVENVKLQYRWDFIEPEDIPNCYTVVTDCKKMGTRKKPPRPMNAFMIWSQGTRRLINELCPKMQNAYISAALGKAWQQKPDYLKKYFEEKKVQLKRFHNIEFPSYKYKPLTKIQKAKEKQELSLTKAKARISKEKGKKRSSKSPLTDVDMADDMFVQKKPKCGRPRKLTNDQQSPKRARSQGSFLTTSGATSPTKPAIKDKLTLKILKDRRSKVVSATTLPPAPQCVIQCSLGQLSPPEVGSPELIQFFKEEPISEPLTIERLLSTESNTDNAMPSSVYDTPANTPPVDAEEPRSITPESLNSFTGISQLKKTQQPSTSSSLSSPSLSSSSPPLGMSSAAVLTTSHRADTPQAAAVPMTSTTARNMPYISAMLSSPSKPLSVSSNTALSFSVTTAAPSGHTASSAAPATTIYLPLAALSRAEATSASIGVNLIDTSKQNANQQQVIIPHQLSSDAVASLYRLLLNKDNASGSSSNKTETVEESRCSSNVLALDGNNNNNSESDRETKPVLVEHLLPGTADVEEVNGASLLSGSVESEVDYSDLNSVSVDTDTPFFSDAVWTYLMKTL